MCLTLSSQLQVPCDVGCDGAQHPSMVLAHGIGSTGLVQLHGQAVEGRLWDDLVVLPMRAAQNA